MKTDIDQLKDAIKITDLATALGLQVRGKQASCYNKAEHKHGDRNFSLGLDTTTNRYKCFACRASGSVIDLYKEVKGVSLSEAITELNKMAGGQLLVKQEIIRENKHGQAKAYRSPIYTPEATQMPITDATAGIYNALLDYCGELDKTSLAYLTGATRGLTKETIKRFQLFSIKDYNATNKFMREKFSLEQLQHAGLYNEKGNLIFYQHKAIIPFIESGRVIFLQGRRTDDQQPKYMHLKRSVPLFNAEILKRLATGERVYICEGVFDAMTIEQAGYKAVAILGVNSFKPQMAELFSGLDVVLCLDNDEQGKRATQDLARVFLLQGQSVKRKLLPDGVKDITEYCIK
jgi:DNA primase